MARSSRRFPPNDANNDAILAAIEQVGREATAGREIAAIERATIAKDLEEHSKQDSDRFAMVTAKLEEVASDVKSLLATRSFHQGAWKMLVVIAGAAGTIAALIVSYFKAH